MAPKLLARSRDSGAYEGSAMNAHDEEVRLYDRSQFSFHGVMHVAWPWADLALPLVPGGGWTWGADTS